MMRFNQILITDPETGDETELCAGDRITYEEFERGPRLVDFTRGYGTDRRRQLRISPLGDNRHILAGPVEDFLQDMAKATGLRYEEIPVETNSKHPKRVFLLS